MATYSASATRWAATRRLFEQHGVALEILSQVSGRTPKSIKRRLERERWKRNSPYNFIHEHQKLVSKLYELIEVHFEHVENMKDDDILGEKKIRALNTFKVHISFALSSGTLIKSSP